MKKKRIGSMLLTGAILVSLVALPGCSNTGSGTPAGSAAESGSASNAEGEEEVSLNITWWGSQSRHDYTKKVLDLYHKTHPNISFQSTPSGWDGYQQKLTTEAAGNTLPDIMQTDWLFINEFTKNGSFADLTSYIDDGTIDLSNVDTNLAASGTIDGKIGSIPISETALAFSYNPDILKNAGVAAPSSDWTWDDFVKACLTVQKKTGNFGLGVTYNTADGDIIFNYYLRQYKKSLFSDDGKKLGYDDDKYFVDFVSMLKKLQDAKACPTLDQYSQVVAKGREQSFVAQKKAAFTWEWANYATSLSSINPGIKMVSMPNDNASVKPMYLKPGMFFSVSNSCKHQKEACEFISWFINDLDANKIINSERGVPISSEVRSNLASNLTSQQKDMFDYIDEVSTNSSEITKADPTGATEVKTILYNEIEKVFYNKVTAQQAASEFRSEANKSLAQNS